mmetsp:Transcript_6948/g.14771  ORF Transcript_6948/g.14771 Transcript_6948/m.14771 type:complete len:126 (+) Transcript_6948:1047-1424(+)
MEETNGHRDGLIRGRVGNELAKIFEVVLLPIDVSNHKASKGLEHREENSGVKTLDLEVVEAKAKVNARVHPGVENQMQAGNIKGAVGNQTEGSAQMSKGSELVVLVITMHRAHAANHLCETGNER